MADGSMDDGVLRRLERIEAQLERLTSVLEQATPAVAMAADAADEWVADLQRGGVDVDARARGVAELVSRLSEPDVLAALQQVVDSLPRLRPLVDVAATFEGTVGMLFDMLDEQVAHLRSGGVDVEERLQLVGGMATSLSEPVVAARLDELLAAAPNLMAATRTAEVFGRAIDEVSCLGREQRLGLLGLVRALREPDVQRAAGFAVDVARRVGERLPEHFDASCRSASS
ncbi:MAG: DUF1641 domain-containing protein [Myxococcales bacterium]|nr:DUF1641 domain-containing protein [Myxococcales bacterium]